MTTIFVCGFVVNFQIYRSYIALGQYDIVQDEIKEDAQTALQAVKLLATYKSKPVLQPVAVQHMLHAVARASHCMWKAIAYCYRFRVF